MKPLLSASSILSLVLVLSLNAFSQKSKAEFNPGWEISLGAGPNYVSHSDDIRIELALGTSFLTESKYRFNKFFSASANLMIANTTDGFKNKTYILPTTIRHGYKESMWALGLNGYFSPLNTGRHEVFISGGGGFCLSDYLSVGFTENYSNIRLSSKRDRGFSYQASFGYSISVSDHFSLSARYMYSHLNTKVEHLLFSFGYKF